MDGNGHGNNGEEGGAEEWNLELDLGEDIFGDGGGEGGGGSDDDVEQDGITLEAPEAVHSTMAPAAGDDGNVSILLHGNEDDEGQVVPLPSILLPFFFVWEPS